MTGKEIALPTDRVLTPEQMQAFLVEYIAAHPEITTGVMLELWPDGSMRGSLGGWLAPRGTVTMVQYPDMKATELTSPKANRTKMVER